MSVFIPQLIDKGSFWQVHFSLEGLRCLACINHCKKIIYTEFPSSSAEIDIKNQSACLRFKEAPSDLSQIFIALEKAGFKACPYREKGFRSDLINLGIAAFSAGNTMLFSLGSYFSETKLEEPFERWFRFLSCALTALSLFFAARSLFSTGLRNLKLKKIDIDLAIALSFLGGFLYSAINTFKGEGDVYFDSLSTAIFLVLVGRFYKNRALIKAQALLQDSFMPDPHYCLLLEDGLPRPSPVNAIKTNDTLILRAGEMLHVDGLILEGQGYCDLSSINGEPKPHFYKEGDKLQGGAFILDACLKIKALHAGVESFLEKAEETANNYLSEKSRWQRLSDHLAVLFVLILFSSACLVFFFQIGGSHAESMRRVVSMLLVACPCALGFALPLAFSRAVTVLSKQGITVRQLEGLERLSKVKRIVFDKTGTLTKTSLHINQTQQSPEILNFAGLAGFISTHHVPKALQVWALKNGFSLDRQKLKLSELSETLEESGAGISFRLKDDQIRIGKASFACQHQVDDGFIHLNKNAACLATFQLSESLYPDTKEVFCELKRRSYELQLLSGDHQTNVSALGDALGLSKEACFANQSPTSKASLVRFTTIEKKSSKHAGLVLMVGNGLNDLLALAGSGVSVAVYDSSELAIKKADFYLRKEGVEGILNLLSCHDTLKIVLKRVLLFSLSYNLCSLSAAILGWINPLVAAVLMPLSSLSIISLATYWPQLRVTRTFRLKLPTKDFA